MKIILKTALVFSFISVFDAMAAEAPSNSEAYYFSPGLAYYHFSDKRDLQNTAMANITLGIEVAESLSLEAFYGQASTNTLPTETSENARFYIYGVDAVYHFARNQANVCHPYWLAGLDVTHEDENIVTSGNTTLLGLNAGLGLEFKVSSSISLFTEARDNYTLSGGENDWMLNAGIIFFFDREAQQSPSIPAKTDGATGFYQLQETPT